VQLPATRVRDLHYGDVLFYFYQDQTFEAITRLSAYQQWQRLPRSGADAQLLLAGLYLELGLHNEAGRRFEQLLTPDIPASVRNRAWFYLGKVWYARGYLGRAEHAIRQVQGALPVALEAEKVHLLANVLMRQGRFDDAVQLLNGWRGPADWVAFAQFNLGVALVRKGSLDQAVPFLNAVGALEVSHPELLALKDRANLALGFAYLQANRPADARPVLERVRLNGPYSNKALLGAGWADAAAGDFRSALRPWLELHDRDLLDAAVQESYLAVPYAYAKLNANAQAAEAYETAILAYDTETRRLDQSIEKLRGGKLLDDLLAKEEATGRYGWFWQLAALPDAPESRYLYALLADHDFQEGLKNYRDLAYLDRTLTRWTDNLAVYGDMIDTREKAYAVRVPRADALLAAGGAEKLRRRREELGVRLEAVERDGDVAALGTARQRDQWARVRRIEDALAAQGTAADPDLAAKARLVKGVLLWRLQASRKERLWRERRSLKDLDSALGEMQSRWVRVERARASAPHDTGHFATRLVGLTQQLQALRTRLADARVKQNALLADIAVSALTRQKDRLATYQIQARFALGSVYDRAANADAKSTTTPPAATPVAPIPVAPEVPEPKP
ncbi:MAG: hypothetical protein WCE48_11885, partial [Steroidobacteraceae bacterium]